jgi:Ca2+-binding EF-hand superfamily protein
MKTSMFLLCPVVVFIASIGRGLETNAGPPPAPSKVKPTLSAQRTDFETRDADQSNSLTLDEFLQSQVAEQQPRLKRDFRVVDFDHDDRLSWDEFRSLPGTAFADRGPVPDPLQSLADQRVKDWKQLLVDHDKNRDHSLTAAEWPGEALRAWGTIGDVPFTAWDQDKNAAVNEIEAQQVIDVAHGVRRSDGSLLRLPGGGVIDLLAIAYFDTDKDGIINLSEFSSKYGADPEKATDVFNRRDQNQNGRWEWSEILAGSELVTDVLGLYLYLDTNLNGLVDQAELDAKVQPWQKKLALRLVAAFDVDGDAQLSLSEFRLTPIANLSADWFGNREDQDADGSLSRAEFYAIPVGESPAYLVQFADEQFRHWDLDHNGQLSPAEYEFTVAPPKTPRERFRRRDADRSGDLSLEEYLASQAEEAQARLKRDFGVVDFNRDDRLTWDEFRALPELAFAERGPVPDPIEGWANEQLREWKELLSNFDKNQDNGLTDAEWPAETLKKWGPTGELPFGAWDIDHNGVVTAEEAQQVIELAYGIRRSERLPLRLPSGYVVDLMAMAHFDLNRDGILTRSEFVEHYWWGAVKNEELFKLRDQNGDGQMEWSEIMASPELLSDNLWQFLTYDVDLDGFIDQAELDSKVQGWQQKLARRVVGPFDDDHDGKLSLAEYRRTPIANHNANWYDGGLDRNFDGKLSLSEFYTPETTESPAYSIQFAFEQFRRWDRNHDGLLSADEYDVKTVPPKTPQEDFRRRDADQSGDLSLDEYLTFQAAEQHPRLKRDFGVIDFSRDERLSWDEFRTLAGLPITERGPVPDPLQTAADKQLQAWKDLLSAHDQNRDLKLAETEWPHDIMKSWGPLGEVPFAIWDIDHDGFVTEGEAHQVVDWAFGVRRSDGSRLRLPSGAAADLLYLAYLDNNKDGMLSLTELMPKDEKDPERITKAFQQRDRNQNGQLDGEEVVLSPEILRDILAGFLYCDTSLNGLLDQTELDERLPGWQKKLCRRLVAAFDSDGDGELSFSEYRETPSANLLADWFGNREDRDFDGKLSWSEFYSPPASESPAYLMQFAYRQFHRWDRNRDGLLSSDEYDFTAAPPKTPRDDFRRRDRDQNGELSLDEYLTFQAADQYPRVKRDFGVIDFNHDGRLNWDEFRALPGGPWQDRGPVPDPLQILADERCQAWNELLSKQDKNQDGGLTETEWPREALKSWGPIGELRFVFWDANRNGAVTASEARQLIELSFGIHRSNGGPLRTPIGGVVDLMAMAHFDLNHDGVLTRAEFVEHYWSGPEKNAEIFARRDLNNDGKLDFEEILNCSELVSDILRQFLYFDSDFSGLVEQSELEEKSQQWQKRLVPRLVAAFDEDGNGGLSFVEYRKTPVANHNANWYDAGTDRNYDGKLSLAEFYAPPATELSSYSIQFAFEQFRRWDRNHDEMLSTDEYNITVANPNSPQDDFRRRDTDHDEQLTLEEYLNFQATDQHARLKRDFGVIDFNRDGRLSWDEFRTWAGFPLAERGSVPDPIQAWADALLAAWKDLLLLHGKNRDAGLAQLEWPHKEMQKWGPLGEVAFAFWDADQNGVVSSAEAQRLIDLAFGIRRSDGVVLRFPSGGVMDLMVIGYLDSDKDGIINLAEYRSKSGNPDQAAEVFNRRDRNQNGRWEWDEISVGSEVISDTLGGFFYLDSNLDGLVNQPEIDARVQGWQKKLTRQLVIAFDDDKDGQLSLAEYRVTPIANLINDWFRVPEDSDFDGKLSFTEFYAPAERESPAYLVQFAYEHFRRWDRNHDGGLSSEEYDFTTNTNNLSKLTDPALVFRFADKNHDGGLTSDEAFVEPNPDAKNTGAVMDYHRRKMRSGEAFFSADKNRDQRLNLDEYLRYREILEQVGTKPRAAAPIPPAVVSRDWGEILVYGVTGLNVALALIGAVYWSRHRRGK